MQVDSTNLFIKIKESLKLVISETPYEIKD